MTLHPFRTAPLTGTEVGWFRPAFAIILALVLPALLALVLILNGAPVVEGPPKDGSGYTWGDHIGIVLGMLTVSPLVSWVVSPVALVALRAAAMLGWAGWGTAILTALGLGMPLAHLLLNGDLTTDEYALPVHLAVAISLLGLAIWATFWISFRLIKARTEHPDER